MTIQGVPVRPGGRLRTASFDANNHMIGASYDAAGNMLNDGYHSYVYDAENRIIQVDSGDTATYTYDAEGRRVRKVAGSAVDYVYDHAGHELAEVNTSGAWTRGRSVCRRAASGDL